MELKKRSRKKAAKVNRVLTVVGAALCVVLGFMLICNMTIIIKGAVAPDMPPSVLGTTPLVVLSGSMSGDAPDHIEAGDLIFVKRIKDPAALKEGDVIAFMQHSVTVTHRIIGIEAGEDGKLLFTTKGDANNAVDQSPVSEDALVGLFVSRIPRIGDFALFLQTPLGMAIFVGLPLIAFIVYDIIRRQRYSAAEGKKTAALEAEVARLRALAGESEKSEQ